MAINTLNSPGILAPEEVGPLIIQPLRLRSVALRMTTVIQTLRPSLRFPIVDADAAASWVVEGDAIAETDPTLGDDHQRPAGLGSIDYQTISVDGAFYNFDWALQAISQVEQYGSVLTGFAASFATVELLSQIKRFEATAEIVSNEPLLAETPGTPSRR